MNIKKLDLKIKEVAANYLKLEAELLDLICKMDSQKGFVKLGYASLFVYCKERLGLSESISYKFINVARKANQVPEFKQELCSGKITVAKAQKMTSVINRVNVKSWLSLAQEKSHKELEREVAKVSPNTKPKEKYVKVENKIKVDVQITLKEEVLEKLKRVQDINPGLSTEDALEEILNFYLERKDPVKKAERASAKKSYKPREELMKHNISKGRRPIPAPIRHQVMLRDRGCCTHKGCNSTRYLEFHHIRPVACGGEDSVENLRLLCSNHHRFLHQQE